MSSLLSKLKTLLSAGARGPKRYGKKQALSTEAEPGEGPQPEVTEAQGRRRQVPEVTEAPPSATREAPAQTITPTEGRSATRVEDRVADQDQSEALEEGRVADLLKGDES